MSRAADAAAGSRASSKRRQASVPIRARDCLRATIASSSSDEDLAPERLSWKSLAGRYRPAIASCDWSALDRSPRSLTAAPGLLGELKVPVVKKRAVSPPFLSGYTSGTSDHSCCPRIHAQRRTRRLITVMNDSNPVGNSHGEDAVSRLHRIDLTDEQRAGIACASCGRDFGIGEASVPVTVVNDYQIFVHELGCAGVPETS